MKRILLLLLLLVLLLSFAVPAFVPESYSDLTGEEWYAEAVYALRERGIMNGVENNQFGGDRTFTRAQLATVLYRLAGSPAVTGEDSFSDTQPGTWYSDAVLWASQTGVVNGIGDGRYGTDNPATQEQLAVMLWRDAGSYVLGNAYALPDGVENSASDYAVDAVRWARVEELLTDAVAFEPKADATRAQVADMVYRYLLLLEQFADVDAISSATQKEEQKQENGQKVAAGGKILIAYFSRTGENYSVGVLDEGNTAKLAKEIAAQTGGDLFEIIPVLPYPESYDDTLPIATAEKNSDARPEIKSRVENFEQYDTIFIGYPIWWGDLPMILHTFMENYDFTGKTVIPFNTHEGSGQSGTQSVIANKLSHATVLQGLAMRGSTAQALKCDGTDAAVKNWLDGLGLLP